jgi:1-phosphofructokinase
MIVTLTINSTFDQTLFIPHLAMNHTVRAREVVYSMGGKPTDCSWILGQWGLPSLALGCVAGMNGGKIVQMLEQQGVTTDFIEAEGESRLNTVVVVEDGSGQFTITTNTLSVTEKHLADLRPKYSAALEKASVVVLGGTLPNGIPPSLYAELIQEARQRGLPVIFDADEPNLSAGLAGHPTYIKPNRDELEALVGHPLESLEAIHAAGQQIIARYAACPIISLGSEGGLAVLPDRSYRIPPLAVPVVSASGAGDGILAGLTASIHQDQPIEEGIRLGFAFASAIVMQAGTAAYDPSDVERLLPQVRLEPFPAS